jgi:hypothetical protein
LRRATASANKSLERTAAPPSGCSMVSCVFMSLVIRGGCRSACR